MAVTFFKEKQTAGRHTYRGVVLDREFIVQTDSASDNAETILNYDGIPVPQEKHPVLTETWVESVSATPIDNKTWTVSVKYANKPITRFTAQRGSFAWQVTVLGLDSTTIQEEMAVDLSDPPQPVVNTAGIPIAGVMRTTSIWKLTVQRFEPTFSPAFAVNMSNTINESPFIGAAAFQVLLGGIKATPVVKGPNDERLWDVRYPFSLKLTQYGWEPPVISVGTHAFTHDNETGEDILGPVTATLRTPDGDPILRDDGKPEIATVTEPVLLDADGFVAQPGAEPVELFFRRYRQRDFGVLNLEAAINAAFG